MTATECADTCKAAAPGGACRDGIRHICRSQKQGSVQAVQLSPPAILGRSHPWKPDACVGR